MRERQDSRLTPGAPHHPDPRCTQLRTRPPRTGTNEPFRPLSTPLDVQTGRQTRLRAAVRHISVGQVYQDGRRHCSSSTTRGLRRGIPGSEASPSSSNPHLLPGDPRQSTAPPGSLSSLHRVHARSRHGGLYTLPSGPSQTHLLATPFLMLVRPGPSHTASRPIPQAL